MVERVVRNDEARGSNPLISTIMSSLPVFCKVFVFSYYIICVGLHLALMFGIFLEWLREKKALKNASANPTAPAVSIIIPFHNEENRIGALLKSLVTQDYINAEYIFVNDRSSDNSPKLIGDFIKGLAQNGPKARMISLTENPGPNYKQYALARGIEISNGEFLLFTDADCQIPPTWIGAMIKRMSNEKTGAAIGPVFKRSGGKGFFHLYQCFEHGIRYVYLAGATGLGAAGGGFGNNLILRRSCLDAVGGYDKIPPSPTEDAALISEIRSRTNYQIRSALGRDVHVITQGEDNWKNLINQTLRWNNGGLFCPDLITRLNYNFLMIIITLGVLPVPLLPFFPFLWLLPFGQFTIMVFNTIANIGLFGVSLPKKRFCFGYALTLLFTPVYFTLMTLLGYLGFKATWKGKEL